MEQIQVKNVTRVSLLINATTCPACGLVFGLSNDYECDRRQDHNTFYCPNGHSQSYKDDPQRQEIERLQGEKADLRAANDRLCNDLMDAAKEAKRLKRRAAAGTCEVCHRTFANKGRHMAGQHPEFVASVQHGKRKEAAI